MHLDCLLVLLARNKLTFRQTRSVKLFELSCHFKAYDEERRGQRNRRASGKGRPESGPVAVSCVSSNAGAIPATQQANRPRVPLSFLLTTHSGGDAGNLTVYCPCDRINNGRRQVVVTNENCFESNAMDVLWEDAIVRQQLRFELWPYRVVTLNDYLWESSLARPKMTSSFMMFCCFLWLWSTVYCPCVRLYSRPPTSALGVFSHTDWPPAVFSADIPHPWSPWCLL